MILVMFAPCPASLIQETNILALTLNYLPLQDLCIRYPIWDCFSDGFPMVVFPLPLNIPDPLPLILILEQSHARDAADDLVISRLS